MISVDLHCDTLTHLSPWEDLERNNHMVSIPKLRAAQALLQCCAVFVPTGRYPADRRDEFSSARYRRVLANYQRLMARHGAQVRPILGWEDVERCRSDGKIGILLTVEDGSAIGSRLEDFASAYEQGVRLVTLTWNFENRLGWPHARDPAVMGRGLKPFGLEAVAELERLGILVDVSHLSDGGFWDVARQATKPFVASHSNSRAVTNHTRNLTDAMICAIADRGGVVGLNYFPDFLRGVRPSRMEDLVRHALHIRNVGGRGVLALGSDFDGIDGQTDLRGPQDIPKLAQALRQAGLPESELEDIWSGNALRVLKSAL